MSLHAKAIDGKTITILGFPIGTTSQGFAGFIEAGIPYYHTGTDEEITVKDGKGVLINVIILSTLLDDVIISVDNIQIPILKETVAGTLFRYTCIFNNNLKVKLLDSRDKILIIYC